MNKTIKLIEDMFLTLEAIDHPDINYEILEKLIRESDTEIAEMIKVQEDYETLMIEFKEYVHMSEYMKIIGEGKWY